MATNENEEQAHAPYTALHTLSLLQMPVDLEVNVSMLPATVMPARSASIAFLFLQMSTFLHRVRGPTIGISCLDLFVVTNASISNVTLTACLRHALPVIMRPSPDYRRSPPSPPTS